MYCAEDAIAVNEAGQEAEGIERIEADGTLVLTEVAKEVLSDLFQLDQGRIQPDETQEFAGALLERFGHLARRYGIHLTEFEQPQTRLKPVWRVSK